MILNKNKYSVLLKKEVKQNKIKLDTQHPQGYLFYFGLTDYFRSK